MLTAPVNESPMLQFDPTEQSLQSERLLISTLLVWTTLRSSTPPDAWLLLGSSTSTRTCANPVVKKLKRLKLVAGPRHLADTPQLSQCRIPNQPLIRLRSFARFSTQASQRAFATFAPQAPSRSAVKAMLFHPWPNLLRRVFASSPTMDVACRTTDLCVGHSNTPQVCLSLLCSPSTARSRRSAKVATCMKASGRVGWVSRAFLPKPKNSWCSETLPFHDLQEWRCTSSICQPLGQSLWCAMQRHVASTSPPKQHHTTSRSPMQKSRRMTRCSK
ncbi:unannotated protein [freshwater metagenome]|uniref:Unannotated protein n=1 Tax=freshwater metagenome TaxID=449393 RepID=A0A6J6CXD7_9ZZZZ